jgi:hypothetical protein
MITAPRWQLYCCIICGNMDSGIEQTNIHMLGVSNYRKHDRRQTLDKQLVLCILVRQKQAAIKACGEA